MYIPNSIETCVYLCLSTDSLTAIHWPSYSLPKIVAARSCSSGSASEARSVDAALCELSVRPCSLKFAVRSSNLKADWY